MKTLLVCVLAGAAIRAQPPLTNAQLEVRASQSLDAEIRRIQGPAWAGYEVPAARKDADSCCSWRGCGLESNRPVRAANTGPVKLESSGKLAVLFRVAGGKVEKVRAFAMDCALDAGGLPFVWLTGVSPAASVDLLSRIGHDALPALAMQGGMEADNALVRMARDESSARARGQALFWLAQKASARAIGAIDYAVENDPDTEVKKKAVFALSQLPKDDGVPKLIDVAKNNRNMAVRKQAMFWLGQSNDPRALRFLEEILLK